MKSLPRIGCQFVWSSLLAATLGAGFGLAQTPDDLPIPKGPAATLRSVKMISDAEGPALEIVSSQTPQPAIEFLDSPPRLVIDLPHTMDRLPRKRLEVGSEQVSAVRINQFQQTPPVARVVVDLVHPVGYSSDSQGQRLLVRMHPMAEARRNIETPSVPAFTKGVQPAFVPVVPGSYGSGGRSGQPALRRFRCDGRLGDYDFAPGSGWRSARVSQDNSLRDAFTERS